MNLKPVNVSSKWMSFTSQMRRTILDVTIVEIAAAFSGSVPLRRRAVMI